jgi:hypothetical protein
MNMPIPSKQLTIILSDILIIPTINNRTRNKISVTGISFKEYIKRWRLCVQSKKRDAAIKKKRGETGNTPTFGMSANNT